MAVAAVAYTALFTWLFAPGWRGVVFGPGDSAWFYFPAYASPRAVWSGSLFAGHPLFADPQFFSWYPPALFLRSLGVAYDGFVIGGFVLCALAGFALALVLTGSRTAAFVGGLAWALSGFMVVHAVHPPMVHAGAWLAAALACLELLRRHGGPAPLAGIAASVALLWLAGSPQLATWGSLVLGAFAVASAWPHANPAAHLARAAFAGALGVALASVQLLPSFELSGQSVREQIPFEEFAGNAYKAMHLVTLLLPRYFGGGEVPYFGPAATDLLGYLGIATLLLVGAAASTPGLRYRGFFFAVALAGLLLSLGSSTPLFRLIYAVPVLKLFRGATRHFFELSLATSMLAAYGVIALRESSAQAKRGLFAAAALVLAGIAAAALFAPFAAPGRRLPPEFSPLPWRNPAIGVPLLHLAAAAVLLAGWHRLPRRVGGLLLCALLFADLALFARTCDWTASPPESIAEPPPELVTLRGELKRSHRRLLLAEGFWDPVIGGNIGQLWDVPSLSGYSPLMLSRIQTLLGIDANGKVVDRARLFARGSLALDQMAVRYVLFPAADPQPGPEGRFEPAGTLGADRLMRNPRAMPRAWLAPRAVVATEQETIAALHNGVLPGGEPFGLRDAALVEHALDLPSSRLAEGDSARVDFESAERLEVEVVTRAGALLVTSDLFYPGWRARIDAEELPVLRANYLLRAVVLPPGTHRVVFSLESRTLAAGRVISGLALAILAGLAVWALLRRLKR